MDVILENPLQKCHEQAEASFLPYGPLIQIVESFGQPEIEYAAIRKGTGLMDCPHRGVLEITGKVCPSAVSNPSPTVNKPSESDRPPGGASRDRAGALAGPQSVKRRNKADRFAI